MAIISTMQPFKHASTDNNIISYFQSIFGQVYRRNIHLSGARHSLHLAIYKMGPVISYQNCSGFLQFRDYLRTTLESIMSARYSTPLKLCCIHDGAKKMYFIFQQLLFRSLSSSVQKMRFLTPNYNSGSFNSVMCLLSHTNMQKNKSCKPCMCLQLVSNNREPHFPTLLYPKQL